MAKERQSGKRPDDGTPGDSGQQGDDILSDSGIEELDLESLLAEESTDEVASASAKGGGRPGKAPGGKPEGAIIDDGDLDLLSDTVIEEISASDLLEVEEESVAPSAGVGALSSDAATNGQRMSPVEDEVELLGDVDETLIEGESVLEEISQDPDPTPVQAPVVAAAAMAASVAAAAREASVAPQGDEKQKGEKKAPRKGFLRMGKKDSQPEPDANEMKESDAMAAAKEDPEGHAEDSQETEAAPKEKAKKGAKPPKAPKPAKKEKPAKVATKKAPKVKPAASDVHRPAAAVKVGGSVAFVCSECYEEFLLPSSYSQEMVSCPECLHVGKRPDADFLRTVTLHKAGERKSFLLALVVGVVLMIVAFSLIWLTSDMHLAQGKSMKPDSNLVLGLVAGSGILAALFIWLSLRSEGNRWEVYF